MILNILIQGDTLLQYCQDLDEACKELKNKNYDAVLEEIIELQKTLQVNLITIKLC